MNSLGLDVHKKDTVAADLDLKTGCIELTRIESNPDAVRGFLSALDPSEYRVALEASCHWGWVVDLTQSMDFDVVLSHPKMTKVIAASKKKTDKVDATMLAKLLASGMLPEAHISTPQVREQRSYLRHRCILVRVRTAAKNRIHSILAGHGLKPPCKDLFCQKGLAWLYQQKFALLYQEEISNYLEQIDLLAAQISHLDIRISPMAEQDEQARLLTGIHGIAYFSALLVVLEIDGVHRFPSAKHLVSFGGLCPSTWSSGGHERHGPITKCGSPFLRWVLVEAAQKASYPGSPFHRSYQSVLKKKGKSVAKVATARKLLESIYQMLKTNQPFDARAWNPRPDMGRVASTEA